MSALKNKTLSNKLIENHKQACWIGIVCLFLLVTWGYCLTLKKQSNDTGSGKHRNMGVVRK